MTREEVLALSDADLVARVVERVMGWTNVSGAWMNGDDWTLLYAVHPRREETAFTGDVWSPLTDWNHCMMVVEAMEAKGWRWFLSHCGAEFQLDIDNCYAVGRSGKRAILEAALIATESK